MSDQNITLVLAGGEIAMSVTDGTIPSRTPLAEEVSEDLPECFRERVKIIDWSHQPGSHYSVRMTADLIELLSQQVTAGASAVAVLCGADAIEEMAYLADLLWVYPQPLIFTATHMPKGPDSDDIRILLNETLLAASSRETWGQGVLVCADGELFAASDIVESADYGRKGFEGTFRGAIGSIIGQDVVLWQAPKRSKIFDAPFTPAKDVELLFASLGAGERFLQLLTEDDEFESIDGLVIAGFGGGNVYPAWVPYLRTLCREDIPVVMVSRCTKGTVLSDVPFEGSFAKLHELGVMSGGFLTPLRARLKLAVGIGAGLKGEELQNYLLDK